MGAREAGHLCKVGKAEVGRQTLPSEGSRRKNDQEGGGGPLDWTGPEAQGEGDIQKEE